MRDRIKKQKQDGFHPGGGGRGGKLRRRGGDDDDDDADANDVNDDNDDDDDDNRYEDDDDAYIIGEGEEDKEGTSGGDVEVSVWSKKRQHDRNGTSCFLLNLFDH